MSITDELRKWASVEVPYKYGHQLTAIADRIDAEHKRLMQEQPFTIDMVPMTDERMAEHGWVRLPVDADGEVWHVGDFAVGEVNPRNPKAIERMIWYGPDSGWQLETDTIIYPCPDRPRHYHAPTVEDVLREFVTEFNRDDSELCDEEIIEQFAAKLRLKEGA